MSKRGLFITFEGCEGSGKTTQSRMLQEWFTNNNIQTASTREPGGTPTAEKVRSLLLDPEIKLEISSQLLLLNVSRIEHVADVIKPNLNNGINVICDRFLDSTIVYQHYAHGMNIDFILSLHKNFLDNITPDITFILDLNFSQHVERLNRRKAPKDRYEKLDQTFHETVIDGFRDLAAKNPKRCHLLSSANRSPQNTHEQIVKIVKSML